MTYDKDIDGITGKIVDAAVKIHTRLGLASVHPKQLRTYLRLPHLPACLLINFAEVRLKDGMHCIVNNCQPSSATPQLRATA